MSTTTIVAVYADLFESSHNIKKRDRRRPELKTLVEMPHFATHHTTEEHVKKKKKKSTDPKEATSPECKCRRTPPSSRYLQCRHILNSLRISCETDPTERKACETDTGSTAEPNSDLRGEQLNEIRSNEHRSVAEARAQRGREKTTNRIEARAEIREREN